LREKEGSKEILKAIQEIEQKFNDYGMNEETTTSNRFNYRLKKLE